MGRGLELFGGFLGVGAFGDPVSYQEISDPGELLATALAAVAVSCAAFGLVQFLMLRLNFVQFVQYPVLRNNASGPQIGLPGRSSAKF